MNKVKNDKEKQTFEKEMKKIQKQEGFEKIKEGMQNKSDESKYYSKKSTVSIQKDNEQKQKLLNEFEKQFISKVKVDKK